MVNYSYIDTCILADILKQYQPINPNNPLIPSTFLKTNILKEINIAIESEGYEGMLITSSFSFIELINKFNDIFKNCNIESYKISNFLRQPPVWITIEELNENITSYLCEVPISNSHGHAISGDDAIHVATAISRQEKITFCTTDLRLANLNIKNISFVSN